MGKLEVSDTAIGKGDIKLFEPLVTREGVKLAPGNYRISVVVSTTGQGQFLLASYGAQAETRQGVDRFALNVRPEARVPDLAVAADVVKNTLVKGIASNIEGTFNLEILSPTEAILEFTSKQFEANALLGRSLDSKLVDLLPAFVTLEESADCGTDCIEGYIKVSVKNQGNAEAKGKWNVMLRTPRFYVGTVSDVPASGEIAVTSSAKIKFPCCSAAQVEAEVHADFYNQDGIDANDANNSKRFAVKLKEQ